MDIEVLNDTIMDGFHTKSCEGYHIVDTNDSSFKDGVSLLFNEIKDLQIEGIYTNGPNAMSCYLTYRRQILRIIGLYFTPGDSEDKIQLL